MGKALQCSALVSSPRNGANRSGFPSSPGRASPRPQGGNRLLSGAPEELAASLHKSHWLLTHFWFQGQTDLPVRSKTCTVPLHMWTSLLGKEGTAEN